MKLSFLCRASKANKSGLAPIELSVIINKQRKIFSLERRCLPTKIDEEFVDAVRSKCYSIENECTKLGLPLTVDTFLYYYKNGFKHNMTLKGVAEEFIALQRKRVEAGLTSELMVKRYIRAIDYFKSITGDKPMRSVFSKDIEEYYIFLRKRMTNNSANNLMKRVKTMLEYAVKQNYITTNPFTMELHYDKTNVEALTAEELNILITKNNLLPRIEKVKDLFILQCFTGLAYCDLAALNANSFKIYDGKPFIIQPRRKTDVVAKIPLLPAALRILEKYQYKLPLLTNQRYNGYLKELGDICGITKKLHTHIGRHTFATLLVDAGIPLTTIATILGHSSTRITEAVYAHPTIKSLTMVVNTIGAI